MEDKKKSAVDADKEILFSKSIKAGKRIYYLDVKKNRKDEMFISITESKKVVTDEGTPDQQVTFEKHKIFLYQEDFGKFMEGINEIFNYIEEKQGPYAPYYNNVGEEGNKSENDEKSDNSGEIKIDIDF